MNWEYLLYSFLLALFSWIYYKIYKSWWKKKSKNEDGGDYYDQTIGRVKDWWLIIMAAIGSLIFLWKFFFM